MSTTEQKALALRLADHLIENAEMDAAEGGNLNVIDLELSAAAELRRLSAENEALRLRLMTAERGTEDAAKAEVMYHDAERLLTSDERTLNDEVLRLRAQVEALTKPASRWNWLSDLMQVHWSEGKFTSLVRIVSEEWRDAINASVDRMMAGDLPDAGTPPQNQAIQAAQERWTHDCPAIHVAAVASWSDKCRHCGAERSAPSAPQPLTQPAVPGLDDVDWPDVEDMAHGALQEALSFGLSHDVINRFGQSVLQKTRDAMLAAAPQPGAQPTEAAQKGGV